jgi:hypothetical protein
MKIGDHVRHIIKNGLKYRIQEKKKTISVKDKQRCTMPGMYSRVRDTFVGTLIKNKIKFSLHIRKCRREQLQSHI